jgi:metallophosphoesterase superfamily enzyme
MPQANRSCIPHLYPQFGYIKTGGVKAFGSKTNCFILSLQCKRFLLIQPAFNTLHAGNKIQYGERNDTCSTSDQVRINFSNHQYWSILQPSGNWTACQLACRSGNAPAMICVPAWRKTTSDLAERTQQC